MSPTSPNFAALNVQLNKAHSRIRELEARETELLAQIRSLCAVITELSYEVDPLAVVELNSRVRDGRHERQMAARENTGVQDVSQQLNDRAVLDRRNRLAPRGAALRT
jgi:hypothetical protein